MTRTLTHGPAVVARASDVVCISPGATAMVWTGVGRSHEPIAVPGVGLAPGDALVAVELATVCESDVHTVRGDRPSVPPLVLGHEQVGTIVELGRGGARATDGRRLNVGDRVVWSTTVPCRRCTRCRHGLGQKCPNLRTYGHERTRRGWELSGGFASHVHVVAGTPIVAVAAELPAAVVAPASCAMATAAAVLEAATAIVPLEGETVLIAGAGMRGLAAAAMAKDAGAHVVVSDPDRGRREAARAFGAEAVADPRVHEGASGSLGVQVARTGRRGTSCRIALEFSGEPAAVRALASSLDVGGVLVLGGGMPPGAEVPIDPDRIVRRLLTIRGVHNYAPRHLERAVAFLADAWRRYPFGDQVASPLPLARIDDAIAAAARGVHTRVSVSSAAAL
jgi:putative phosphonate catabolism associated alcohol dehydrogenase